MVKQREVGGNLSWMYGHCISRAHILQTHVSQPLKLTSHVECLDNNDGTIKLIKQMKVKRPDGFITKQSSRLVQVHGSDQTRATASTTNTRHCTVRARKKPPPKNLPLPNISGLTKVRKGQSEGRTVLSSE
jgi:hypothetical protein